MVIDKSAGRRREGLPAMTTWLHDGLSTGAPSATVMSGAGWRSPAWHGAEDQMILGSFMGWPHWGPTNGQLFKSNNGGEDMTKVLLRAIGVAGGGAVATFSYGASAQDKKAPAKKPPTSESVKDEGACRARNDCDWVAESKDDKGKVKRKASCRASPAPKKA